MLPAFGYQSSLLPARQRPALSAAADVTVKNHNVCAFGAAEPLARAVWSLLFVTNEWANYMHPMQFGALSLSLCYRV